MKKKVLFMSMLLCGTMSVFASSDWTMNTSCGVAVDVKLTSDDPTVSEITAAWNAVNASTCPGAGTKAHISIQG